MFPIIHTQVRNDLELIAIQTCLQNKKKTLGQMEAQAELHFVNAEANVQDLEAKLITEIADLEAKHEAKVNELVERVYC